MPRKKPGVVRKEIVLDASGSIDPIGNRLRFRWDLLAVPLELAILNVLLPPLKAFF